MYAVDERRLDDRDLEPLAMRAREGDQDAFESIVRTLQGPIRAFARRLMRDPHTGDDAAQEAFLRMWRGLGSYGSGRFVAWAFTVTRNTCVELLRKEVRTPVPVESLPEGPDGDPEERRLVRRAVREAISGLAEPYRSTFLLREHGLSYEEVGEALECPVGTVRSRLHEARRLLAQALAPVMSGGA